MASPDGLTEPPIAIVVDTNCWDKGHYNWGKLEWLAQRAGRRGIEVWVPGQVVAEWARHFADDAAQVNLAANRISRAGLAEKTTRISEDVATLDSDLRKSIEKFENVRILPEHGASAVAAIRDQIFGTGPGSVKQGIRTGAADSAMVRDVEAEAGTLDLVVFATSNKKDFEAAAKALGYESVALVRPGTLDIYLAKFASPPNAADPAAVASLIGEYLISRERAASEFEFMDDPLHEPWLAIYDLGLAVGLSDPLDVATISDIRMTPRASIIGVWNVDALESNVDEQDRTVTTYEFKIVVIGDVDIEGYDLDNDGSIVMQNDTIFDSLIVAPFIVDIVDNAEIIDEPHQVDVADVSRPTCRFNDADEALDWLTDVLLAFASAEGDDEPEWRSGDPILLKAGGGTASVAVSETHDEGWEAAFDLGSGHEVTIACSYDSGAQVWAGQESFNILPPFVVVGHGVASGKDNPYLPIGEIWRHLVLPAEETTNGAPSSASTAAAPGL